MRAIKNKKKLRCRQAPKEKPLPIATFAAMLLENAPVMERDGYLAEATISLEQIIGALTDKDKVLNFPIALPPIELGKKTIASIYAAALILAVGAIATGAIIKSKK
jgi:hypothetical protein